MLRVLCVCGLVVVAAGCGSSGDASDGAEATFVRGSTAGLLTEVSEARLVLQPDDPAPEQVFAIRQTDRPRLDLPHLQDHVRQAWPVVVFWESAGGERYAVQVDDA